MVDYKAIGRRLAFYRKKRNMTQSAFSEKLGVTESYISQIERGSSRIAMPRLEQAAKILGVDMALLVSDRATVDQNAVNSEISEIIKDWSAEEISELIDYLLFADSRRKKREK